MASLTLDARLAADTLPVCDLKLCAVRLMNDASYPWLVLVPRRAGLVEILDLDAGEQGLLMQEIAAVAAALRKATGCHKLNIAALGNQVPQLHVHIIARFLDDPAWPDPVWGRRAPVPWEPEARSELMERIRELLDPA